MKFEILKNKLAKTFLISSVIAVIVTMLLLAGVLGTWETKISDAFYSPDNADENIVIVTIDDESLQELGQWPCSWRPLIAQVIDNLNQSSVIGIDIAFPEPTEDDSILAESLKNADVVLAMEYTKFSFKDGELYGENLLKPHISLGVEGEDFKVGFVNLYTDADGVTRSFDPHITGSIDYDHFSKVIAEEYLGFPPEIKDSITLIKYYDEPGGYKYYSFTDIYHKRVNLTDFAGKIVLIGATAANLHDDAIVPISAQAMPGVEINANLVQEIILQDYIYYQDTITVILFVFLFALITGFLLYKFKIHIATIVLAAIIIVFIIGSIYVFNSSGVILKIIYPIFSIALVYIALVVVYYKTEERGRKWIT